jgi:DNA-binding NarL/FixJ family response regulator
MIKENEIKTLRLLIVDDHKMVRDGLRVMLSTFKKQMQFTVEEAENGEQALRKISQADFDVVLMDYHMPGISGAETIQRMLRFKKDIKILVVSNYDELPYIQNMLDAGAKGYILKNIEPFQLLTALKTVLENKIYYSSEVALKLLEITDKGKPNTNRTDHELTRREMEILKLIALELTNEEIAEKLNISKRTVEAHRQNLLYKLHAKNTVGLIKAAYKLKLITQ